MSGPDRRPAPGTRAAHLLVAALIVGTAPLLLLIANRDWFVTPEGFLDPWQYVGFFRQYEDLDYSPGDYKLGRLPWILVGYGITRLLPTMPAAYVLHALFLCLTPLAMFGAVFAAVGRPALAGVVALCFGFYAHAHGSGGWDYHNTASGLFYLTAVWLSLLPAATRGQPVLVGLAGAFAALAVHTNLTLVNLLPALVFVHLYASWVRTGTVRPQVAWRALAFIAGAVLATAFLGAINWKVGRGFIFFDSLLRVTGRYLTERELQAGLPLTSPGWLVTARHLAFPAAVFLGGVASLFFFRRSTSEPAGRLAKGLVLQFVGLVVLWTFWQALGHTALDWDYMAYGLIPTGFLALAGLLDPVWPASFERRRVVALLGTTAVLLVCLTGIAGPVLEPLAARAAPVSFFAGAAVFLAGMAICAWRRSTIATAVFVTMFAVGNQMVATGYQSYTANDPCKTRPATYKAIVDAATWLMTLDPLYNRTRIWFDEREIIRALPECTIGLGPMAYSIRSMSSMNYAARPFPLPAVADVPDESIRSLAAGDAILAIVTDAPSQLEAWRRRLASLGLAHAEIGRERVPILEGGFTIHAWTITPSGR